jgi:membrane protease YdiL (CAAX protease family)
MKHDGRKGDSIPDLESGQGRLGPSAAPERGSPITLQRLFLLGGWYVAAMALTALSWLASAAALIVGVIVFRRVLVVLIDRHLLGTWRQLNTEELPRLGQESTRRTVDPRLPVVFATSAIVLTAIEYYGGSGVFRVHAARLLPVLTESRYFTLMGLAYWSLFRLLFYVVVPALVVRLALRGERFRDYGLSTAGFTRHLKVYGLLYLIVLPPLIVASRTAPFRRTYPFYKLAARSWLDFVAWEALYVLQFFALELFFRGFMLHPLKPALGAYAIFAMALPYCMIHYDKPAAEAVGAFIAGTVLGTLSLRTRSIWAGVLIHASVAFTMDLLAVIHQAGYPGNPRFVW